MHMAVELRRRKTIDFDDVDEFVQRHIAAFEQRKRERSASFQRSISQPTQTGTTKKQPQRGRVLREWNFDNAQDRIDWARRNGLNPDAEPIGVTTGYLRPETMR